MMIVSSIISPATAGQTRQSGAEAPAQAESVSGGALVPVQSQTRAPERYAARPSAPFVAHLIAMAEQAPQTRPFRREAPAVAHGVYGRAALRGTDAFGRVLSQKV